MATAAALIQSIYSFEPATTPFIDFYTIGTNVATFPGLCGASHSQRPTSFVLPNGSKYDPYQTYDGPVTPGEYSAEKVYKIRDVASSNRALVEGEISNLYHFDLQPMNRQGTLIGALSFNNTNATCTARMIGARLTWTYPKQLPAHIGGPGTTTQGIEYAIATFTFDLITVWTF